MRFGRKELQDRYPAESSLASSHSCAGQVLHRIHGVSASTDGFSNLPLAYALAAAHDVSEPGIRTNHLFPLRLRCGLEPGPACSLLLEIPLLFGFEPGTQEHSNDMLRNTWSRGQPRGSCNDVQYTRGLLRRSNIKIPIFRDRVGCQNA